MGSILVEDCHEPYHTINEISFKLSGKETKCDNYRSIQLADLTTDGNDFSTERTEKLLLLSWLVVLLRTRENDQVSYDWAASCRKDGEENELVTRCLSTSQIIMGLEDTVTQAAAALSSYFNSLVPVHSGPVSSSYSLFLSTSTLSQKSGEMTEQSVLHIETRIDETGIEIHPVWQTENMPQDMVARYIETFIDTFRTCASNPDMSVKECMKLTSYDLDEIWRWNNQLPATYRLCMHDIVSEQAQHHPDKVAISSWDGQLTYSQIDEYSTLVAGTLKDQGVELHDVIPACFEKSRWTIVALLAIMKVGATFVLMDPTLPIGRLQNTAKQVGAKTILTSRKQHEISDTIIPGGRIVVVEADIFTNSSNPQITPILATVPPSALMYIIFTSGSTGVPKGVMISHETYTSSAIPRAEAVGYTKNSRVLDFASYAFDVSIDSMLCTLSQGGCLCIPSDEDRMNDLNEVIRRMRVNYAGLTPSVARILDPDVIASLESLGLGGEAATASDVTRWGQDTRIVIGYGPSECTIGCTINSSAATGKDYVSLGKGNGANIWIVDPNDHESLMPVGAVGELLVEGPIVGQGYWNDPAKTAAAFINDPAWLVSGHKGSPGRPGRLYKTGDLGKYDPDGSGGVVFVGRKDTQVKLRGQRVELGEIECQLQARLLPETSVIAEVIIPSNSGGQPTLVVFIASRSKNRHEETDLHLVELPAELREMLSKAEADMAKVLPRYMMPTAYIPVNQIPVMISRKTDRKRLKQFGGTVDLRQLDDNGTTQVTRQLCDLEERLRQAWSEALKLAPESIRPDDNFFTLGGDSLVAMRLVSICRTQNLDLTVANTFNHPTLSAMAGVTRDFNFQARTETSAFSMISRNTESICLEASQACCSDLANIEDIYPCTPTQESLFTFTIKSAKAYVAQRVACIPSYVSLEVWKHAWEDIVKASPILRTRLVQLQDPGLQQVVLKETISWRYSNDLKQYLENDRNDKMDLGQSLARYAIVNNSQDGKQYMVWTIHHVLYDGWSEPLILKNLSAVLKGQSIDTQANMKDFVKFVLDTEEVAAQEFWRRELKGAVGPQFPRLPSRDYLPTPSAILEHVIPLEAGVKSPFTMATLLRGAWSLVASQYTGSDDVVFGETLTGRDIPLALVESIQGPLIATLPVRVRVDRKRSIESFLKTIQQGVLARTQYQHFGMQNIRKASPDALYACEARTGLVIQLEPVYTGSELGFEQGDVVLEALHFNPYPLMIACEIRNGGIRICASVDFSLIDAAQMKRILSQLETAFWQLTKDLGRKVGEISCLPEAELDQIWSWNKTAPLTLDKVAGTLRAEANIKQGSFYPPAVVPWVCDPRNPSLLSPIGCVGELWLEGNFLQSEPVRPPAWLIAGSTICAGRMGNLQPTGDLVSLKEDSSLTFIGRKENILPVQGYAVDLADLEAQFAMHLPSQLDVAAAVIQSPANGILQDFDQELLVFIEHQASKEDGIVLMPSKHGITLNKTELEGFTVTICDTIPLSLALALRKLDKSIQDSLPPYMVPSAYIIIDPVPTVAEQIDQSVLNEIASRIPQDILAQLRQNLREVWTSESAQATWTKAETILRSLWAMILKIDLEKIDIDDNFFRLGGDSVLAMKLVSNLRMLGHNLTVGEIFQNMRLRDAAKVMKVDQTSIREHESYKPFSTLENWETDLFLSEVIRPKIADSTCLVKDVLPVTDSQALDIRATIHEPRTSVQYTMLYLNQDIDRERLVCACDELLQAHDILRTVFIEHESKFFQVVLDKLDAAVSIQITDAEIKKHVNELCVQDVESNFHLGSSFLKIFYVQGKQGQDCLVIRLSHAQYDGISLPRLLRDLETLYRQESLIDFVPFSKYVARTSEKTTQAKAINYWSSLLDGSSLSVLAGTSAQATDRSIFVTKPVDVSGRFTEITMASLLSAAWALVLARRLQTRDVTFGSITSGRQFDLENVENVVGPCYQFTPIRVPFRSDWTGLELLRYVQVQTAESAAYDFLGFEEISKHCTGWSSEAQFFDSIVHHQDFEDFDTMPFAEGDCKVDTLIPHNDAARPLKAVSIVQGGQTLVGIVGSEKEPDFVSAVLDDLAAAMHQLSACWSDSIVLES